MMNDSNNLNAMSPENASEFLYQLSYCSILKQEMDEAAVRAMVSQAQRKNVAQNITGMLMIEKGLVIQWLEGPKATVRALWDRLQADPRHHCIVELLHRNFATERLFPDWSMQRATRQEMLEIIHDARVKASAGEPSPWAGAISTMCILLDPTHAATYGEAMRNQAASPAQLESRIAA